MSVISSVYFSNALSVANTAMTVNLNSGLTPVEAISASYSTILQAIVDIKKDMFASAVSNSGLFNNTVIMDGTLTLMDNLIVMSAGVVIKDVFVIKGIELTLSDDELNDTLLAAYKANSFTRRERDISVKKADEVVAGKSFEEMAEMAANDEGGCAGGACKL